MLKAPFRLRLTATLLACSLACGAGLVGASGTARAQAPLPAYVPGEVVIQFEPTATPAQIADALARMRGRVRKQLRTTAMEATGRPGLHLAATDLDVDPALRALANHPAVQFAEPNWIFQHQAVSNDPYYTGRSLWGMYGDATTPANQYGSQAGEAWAKGNTGAETVYVGVIDEGIDNTHPDLAANIWTNPHDPVDGVDNDKNGYMDDVHGWDFYHKENTIYDGGDADGCTDKHGTHVAGTIGGVGGNGMGVAGVCWNVKMISGKFLGPNGGNLLDAVAAIDYFTDLKVNRGVNIVALNNSWGGGGYSEALHAAINRAAKAGILFIAAAGNSGLNIDIFAAYPADYDTSQTTRYGTESGAGYDAIISVAAIDSTGAKPNWSNYGKKNVDLGAPGVTIWSTIPGNTYAAFNGTSMATPHVTGATALYTATRPGAGALQIKNAILGSTVPTKSMDRKTVTGGRLNVSGF